MASMLIKHDQQWSALIPCSVTQGSMVHWLEIFYDSNLPKIRVELKQIGLNNNASPDSLWPLPSSHRDTKIAWNHWLQKASPTLVFLSARDRSKSLDSTGKRRMVWPFLDNLTTGNWTCHYNHALDPFLSLFDDDLRYYVYVVAILWSLYARYLVNIFFLIKGIVPCHYPTL
jgi:hypothetical protein